MPSTSPSTGPVQVLVGGYTAEQGGRASGLTSLLPQPAGAELVEASTLALPSPSYLVAHPREPWLFAVSETSPSRVSSVRLRDDGSLLLLSSVLSGGDGACHLALAPDGRRLLVAHYGSGSVSSHLVQPDGRLSDRVDLLTFTGSGPDRERQEAPHAHQVVWHGGEVLVTDLGTDRVHRLLVSPDGRLGEAGPPLRLPAGSGPRHLVVVEDHVVVACELSGRLWVGRADAQDGWREVASVPSSGAADARTVQPSALRADGDQLFVANRGPATVAAFVLDREAGTLTRTAEFGCGGAGPRDLVLGPGRLWVANQADDLLSVFDRRSLPPAAPPVLVPSPTPTCVLLRPPAGR